MNNQAQRRAATGAGLRVLMVSDVYFPRVNGVSTSIQTFRKCLSDEGHRVTLVAPAYADDAPECDVVRVPARIVPLDPEDRAMRWRHLVQSCTQIAADGCDLVHIQTPFLAHYAGVKIARRFGLPVVESYHTFFEEYLHHYVPFLPANLMRFAARRFSASQCNQVDALVVPSQAMLKVLRDYGVRSAASVIPTGVNLQQFSQGDRHRFRAANRIAEVRPVVLYVGRVVFEKNIEFLLRMVAIVRESVPDILFVIAGEGPALPALRKMAEDLGLRDHTLFVGYLDRAGELMDCYRAADAFVFASRTETQGLVLLEAMALGVPVVSTAVMGTADIVGPGRGCLVAQEDAGAFAAQVVRLLGDGPLRERLGNEAREYARRWAEDSFAERMAAFYRSVIEEHRARIAAAATA